MTEPSAPAGTVPAGSTAVADATRVGRAAADRLRFPGPARGRDRLGAIGSLSIATTTFAAATGRPVEIRRALQATSTIRPSAPSAGGQVSPPRWWTPPPTDTAAPETAALPPRGLPRAARQVPNEQNYAPGGFVERMVGSDVLVRRDAETRAAGPMRDTAKLNHAVIRRAMARDAQATAASNRGARSSSRSADPSRPAQRPGRPVAAAPERSAATATAAPSSNPAAVPAAPSTPAAASVLHRTVAPPTASTTSDITARAGTSGPTTPAVTAGPLSSVGPDDAGSARAHTSVSGSTSRGEGPPAPPPWRAMAAPAHLATVHQRSAIAVRRSPVTPHRSPAALHRSAVGGSSAVSPLTHADARAQSFAAWTPRAGVVTGRTAVLRRSSTAPVALRPASSAALDTLAPVLLSRPDRSTVPARTSDTGSATRPARTGSETDTTARTGRHASAAPTADGRTAGPARAPRHAAPDSDSGGGAAPAIAPGATGPTTATGAPAAARRLTSVGPALPSTLMRRTAAPVATRAGTATASGPDRDTAARTVLSATSTAFTAHSGASAPQRLFGATIRRLAARTDDELRPAVRTDSLPTSPLSGSALGIRRPEPSGSPAATIRRSQHASALPGPATPPSARGTAGARTAARTPAGAAAPAPATNGTPAMISVAHRSPALSAPGLSSAFAAPDPIRPASSRSAATIRPTVQPTPVAPGAAASGPARSGTDVRSRIGTGTTIRRSADSPSTSSSQGSGPVPGASAPRRVVPTATATRNPGAARTRTAPTATATPSGTSTAAGSTSTPAAATPTGDVGAAVVRRKTLSSVEPAAVAAGMARFASAPPPMSVQPAAPAVPAVARDLAKRDAGRRAGKGTATSGPARPGETSGPARPSAASSSGLPAIRRSPVGGPPSTLATVIGSGSAAGAAERSRMAAANAELFAAMQASTAPAIRRLLDPESGGAAMAEPFTAAPPHAARPNTDDSGQNAYSREQFERVVDAVVDRIEQRVIDELERRGRRHTGGNF